MQETAHQPVGAATNHITPSIDKDRPDPVYHDVDVESKRIPNPYAVGLYQLFYWFDDFRPIVKAILGFLGRSFIALVNALILAFSATARWAGNSAMSVVNLFIMVAIIYISVMHSLELLRYAGLKNEEAYVGVFVWESTFIFSTLVLMKDFKNGRAWTGPTSIAPWLCFIAGLMFVVISNFAGMADNFAGNTIGIATPILLLLFKGLMAHRYYQGKAQVSKGKGHKKEVDKSKKRLRKRVFNRNNIGETDKALVKESDTVQKTVQKKEQEPVTASSAPKNSENKVTKDTKSTTTKQTKDKKEPITLSDKRVEKERVREIGRSMWKEEGEPPGRKRLKDKARCNDNMAKNVAAELKKEHAKEIAYGIWNNTGTLPGIEQLREEANCSINVAKSVLAELEKELKTKVG